MASLAFESVTFNKSLFFHGQCVNKRLTPGLPICGYNIYVNKCPATGYEHVN